MRQKNPAGFALLDMLMLVALASILIALILPFMTRMTEASKRTVCAQNMGQIHKAITMYEVDFASYPTRGRNHPQDPRSDAQTALSLVYRQYTDDVRIFSCPSKPLDADLLKSILPSNNTKWPHEGAFAERDGESSSYGYSPGHNSNNSRVTILADRKGSGPKGNSDNHGRNAGSLS